MSPSAGTAVASPSQNVTSRTEGAAAPKDVPSAAHRTSAGITTRALPGSISTGFKSRQVVIAVAFGRWLKNGRGSASCFETAPSS